MTRHALVGAFGLIYALVASAWPSAHLHTAARHERPLLLLADRDYPPLSYVEDGVVMGIDVDVAHQLARVLGRDIRIEATDWSSAQQRVLHGDGDGLLSMSVTQERRELYEFTNPITTHDFGLFVRAGDPTIRNVIDVSGRKVAVTSGGLPRRLLETSSTAILVLVRSYSDGFRKLASGEVDAVAADVWVGAYTIEHLGLRNIVAAGPPFASLGGAIAVAKGNRELADQINQALAVLAADGSIATIVNRWRPAEIVFVTRHRMYWIVAMVAAGFVVLLTIGGQAVRQRRRVQADHRTAERRIHLLAQALESASDCIVITDTNERVLYVNDAFRRTYEFEGQEIDGQHISTIRTSADPPELTDAIRTATFEGNGWRGIVRNKTKAGRVFEVSLATSPVRDEDGTIIAAVGVARDRSADAAAEAALRASEEKYRQVVDNARDIIFSIDRDGYCTSMNPAGRTLSGFTADTPRGVHIAHLVAPELAGIAAARLARVLAGDSVPRFEIQILSREGKRLTLELDVHGIRVAEEIVGAQGVARDITARKQLEAQLLQAQKMEAVGRLAGGIAHDFNNILTVIIACAELALLEIDRTSRAYRDLRQILQSATSAASLTHQLLIFSRKGVVVPKVVRLNDAIGALEKMLRRLVGEDVAVVVTLASTAGHVEVDTTQLDQVVMNLVVNARDAMPHGGSLTLATGVALVDAQFAEAYGLRSAREYSTLTITDTGTGMAPDVAARIFDPFFTTKEPGKGTGLGLAMVDGIVRQAGGCVVVDSAIGVGTSFTIYLPKVDEPAVQHAPPPEALIEPASATILLVEDDDAVRTVGARALRARGYTVFVARDGLTALQIAEERHGEIDVLLTDIVMPGYNGRVLAAEMKRREPNLRVIFTTGYVDDRRASRGITADGAVVLQKPYALDLLVTTITAALSRPPTAARVVRSDGRDHADDRAPENGSDS